MTLTGAGRWLKDRDEGCCQLRVSLLGLWVGGTQEVELSGGQRPLDTPGQETDHVCVHVCARVLPV